MSVQPDGLNGLRRPYIWPDNEALLESVSRCCVHALTSSRNPTFCRGMTKSGIAHMFGVYLLEIEAMARGNGKKPETGGAAGMPRFVDVKLDQASREAFVGWQPTDTELVQHLAQLTFEGYRVGCSWSGEHQSYTVSLTGRAGTGENEGLCMTAFAGELTRAIALAVYKHRVVAEGVWLSVAPSPVEAFG